VLGSNLVFLLIRAGAQGAAQDTRALAKYGLKVRQYAVLSTACTEPRTQRELSDFLMLNPSQVVALVDALEERGLVERVPPPTDRRANVVVATADGRSLFDKARVEVANLHESLLGDLGAVEREEFLAVIRRLAFPQADN
jgi:DNA-binding MarR family transcriptional regulator